MAEIRSFLNHTPVGAHRVSENGGTYKDKVPSV